MSWPYKPSKYENNQNRICKTKGCNSVARAKGLCQLCYVMKKKHDKFHICSNGRRKQ